MKINKMRMCTVVWGTILKNSESGIERWFLVFVACGVGSGYGWGTVGVSWRGVVWPDGRE